MFNPACLQSDITLVSAASRDPTPSRSLRERMMNMPNAGTQEVDFKSSSGYMALVFIFIALLAIPGGAFIRMPLISVLAVIALVFLVKGIYMLQPNQSALMMLFGDYRGTDYSTGLRWA